MRKTKFKLNEEVLVLDSIGSVEEVLIREHGDDDYRIKLGEKIELWEECFIDKLERVNQNDNKTSS